MFTLYLGYVICRGSQEKAEYANSPTESADIYGCMRLVNSLNSLFLVGNEAYLALEVVDFYFFLKGKNLIIIFIMQLFGILAFKH